MGQTAQRGGWECPHEALQLGKLLRMAAWAGPGAAGRFGSPVAGPVLIGLGRDPLGARNLFGGVTCVIM